MRPTPVVLAAIVAVTMSSTNLMGQARQPSDVRRVLATFGLSSGAAALTCAFCQDDDKGSIAGLIGFETRVRPDMLAGVEVHWYRHTGGGITRSVLALVPAAHVYPLARRPVFLKVGIGLARFAVSAEDEELHTAVVAGLIGTGVDFRISPAYVLTPYVTWLSGSGGTMRLNGAPVTSHAGLTLRQYGLAIALR